MAIVFTGSSTTGFTATTNGDTYVANQFDTIANTGNGFFFGVTNSAEFVLFGNIIAGADGIKSNTTVATHVVVIQMGASVYGGSDGIEMEGDGHEVTNNGTVIGDTDGGIQIIGPDAVVINNGYASGPTEAIRVGEDGRIINNGTVFGNNNALVANGANSDIANTGLVTASFVGINLAVSGTVNNSGVINAGSAGIVLNSASGQNAFATNSGTITTQPTTNPQTTGAAILGGDGNDIVQNTGVMEGIVELRNGEDSLVNAGTIMGQVALDDGQDGVLNTGSIIGNVDLGGGSDTFTNGAGGSVAGVVQGKAGNDTLKGGTADDDMAGGNGADDLRGRKGDDSLVGGSGTDRLSGGRGNDTLEGGDTEDTLMGGAGNDTLVGGAGQDVLSGGVDADLFVFTDIADSETNSRRDVIRDFQKGQDKIDIDGISNDTFIFLGNSAFTASGDAEVRVTSNAAGNSVVRIDADGDGTADSEINVFGVTGLDAGDFIL